MLPDRYVAFDPDEPDRIRRYTADDVWQAQLAQALDNARASVMTDDWVPVTRLCREYGINVHRANDAINAGELEARIPNGQVRGRRCLRSEFVEWLTEKSMVRCT